MNFLIWIVVGGILGWLASMVMKTDAQQDILLNVVVGIIGALLGGWLISPLLGAGTINQGMRAMKRRADGMRFAAIAAGGAWLSFQSNQYGSEKC